MAKYFKSPNGNKSSIRRSWLQLMGLVGVGLGILLLLSNLPLYSFNSASTPVVVRDGLIVKSRRPELYLFRNYTLHQIIDPTLEQQAKAQQVDDAFLGRYTCGEAVDSSGRPMAQSIQESSQLCSSQPSTTASPTATLLTVLGWLGGIVGLVGGVWWLAQSLYQGQVETSTPLKIHTQQAAAYAGQIEQFLKTNSNQQHQPLLIQVHRWQQAIEELVFSLTTLRQNDLMDQDWVSVPQLIADLEQQLATEINPALRYQLEHILTQRRNQLASLERLQTTIRQSEIQVETTVALLGTIYSQLLAQQSTSHVADYQRLADNAYEEAQRLQDYLEALQEVKNPSCF